MVLNKKLCQYIQCSLDTCLCPEFSPYPLLPSALIRKKGGKRNDTSNKVALNCLANFYVEPQCIHEDHCVQLMLAGFALHRKFANSFNLAQFSPLELLTFEGETGTGFL